MENTFLQSAIKQFEYYKLLGEQTFAQLPEEALTWQYNTESNSIATIVKHLAGNMLSRWTDPLTTDGEKEWRNREDEFENNITSKETIMNLWQKGWACLFEALHSFSEADLQKELFIRNQGHTVTEAINRQLAHYPYHIGQIVFIGKMLKGEQWLSLSIPKGQSQTYNAAKFAAPKHTAHFTDEILKREDGNNKEK